MQQYSNSLFRQFPNSVSGNAAIGVSVSVYERGTTNLVTLYADDDVGGATLPNPLTTNNIGFYSFYAPDGKYTLHFGSSQFPDLNIQLIDALNLIDAFNTAIDATGYVLVDNAFSGGYTVTQRNEALLYDGVYYVWKGALPKVITAGSSVASTGGIGNGAWQAVLDNTLEQRLEAGTAPIGSVTAGAVSDLVEGVADGSAIIAGDFTSDNVATLLTDSQSTISRSLGNKFVRRIFCGIDSLTEGTPNSYTQRLVGFGSAANEQGLFVSLVETNVSDRIGFTAVSAVGNRGVFPRNHSLDGKGLYGEALSGGRFRHLPLVTSGVSREWQTATIYYLQQPGGGSFDFRQYASDGTSSAGITVDTDGELLLQSAQITKSTTTSQAYTEVLNANGAVVIFAILYTTTANDTFRINGGQGGASCQDWARVNYTTLTRWMDLLNIDLYVYNGGTNDRFTTTGSVLRTYIEPYLQAVAAAGTSVLLVEPTQTFDYTSASVKSSEYPPIYRAICNDNKWGFSSMVNELGDFAACSARFGMELDGIHPPPDAHFAYGTRLASAIGLLGSNETPATFSISGGGVFDRFRPDFSAWYVNDKIMAASTETMIFTFAAGATFTNAYVDIDIAARVDSGIEYFFEKTLRVYFRRGSTSNIILCQILKNEEKAKFVGGGWADLALTLNATIVSGQVVVTATSNYATRIFAKVTDVKVLIGSSAGPAAILVDSI